MIEYTCHKCGKKLIRIRVGYTCDNCRKFLLDTAIIRHHESIYKELTDLYEKKNADYEDSFHESYIEDGMTMVRIRLGDNGTDLKCFLRE